MKIKGSERFTEKVEDEKNLYQVTEESSEKNYNRIDSLEYTPQV